MLYEPNNPLPVSAQDASLRCSSKYDLPGGYAVEFTLEGSRLGCAWSPRTPRLSRRVLKAYRAARARFVQSVAAPGAQWAVLEV